MKAETTICLTLAIVLFAFFPSATAEEEVHKGIYYGPEIGTVEVDLLPEGERDSLLGGMPKRFHAHTTHAQTVLTLPAGAVLLARTDHEAHAAFRVGSCAWGVQFHPEYDEDIMRHYVCEQRATLEALGRDPDRVESEVRCVDTSRILSRFSQFSS